MISDKRHSVYYFLDADDADDADNADNADLKGCAIKVDKKRSASSVSSASKK